MSTTTTSEPSPPQAQTASPGGLRLAAVIVGALLALAGLGIGGAAGAVGWALFQQRNGQYLTSPVGHYAVDSYALTTTEMSVMVGSRLPAATAVADIMVSAATDSAHPLFIGIGPRDKVAAYLDGVQHTELASVTFAPFRPIYRTIPGTRAPSRPDQQSFWTAWVEGDGTRQLQASLTPGSWVIVVMNADGSRSVAADLIAGVRVAVLGPVTVGLAIATLVLVGGGVALLVRGAVGLGRGLGAPSAVAGAGGPHALASGPDGHYHSPARLTGSLEPVSRWLWLVKWLLIIPHLLILALLWPAFVVVTVVAGFAILFTGRYPRALFDFAVGVLRWNWRVGFYAYSALGTDRYPPFTLARTDYPADFDVEYPERLSRGLVLVKSWLLALPHLIIVGLLTAPWYWAADQATQNGTRETGGLSLLGLLTLVAALAVLFTGRYPRPLFDLIMGLNRWVYRVISYVALLRDDYPPFRLDQGPDEPDQGPVPAGGIEPASGTPQREEVAEHAGRR